MAHSRALRRAGLLLEVVVAMAILCTAMGLLGAQLTRGIALSSYAEEQMIAQQFSDRILALIEYDLETQELLFKGNETEVHEAFDEDEPEKFWRVRDQYPGYFWRVTVTPPAPTSAPDLPVKQVLVEILHQADQHNPDSSKDAKVVRQVAFLRTEPAKLDLAQLGLGAGALGGAGGGAQLPDGLAGQLPDILALVGGMGDGISFQQLVSQMDRDTVAMLMTFIQQFVASNGGIPPGLGSLDLGNLAGLLGQGGLGGAGGGAGQGGVGDDNGGTGQGGDVRQQIEDALRRQAGGGGGRGGAGGPGGRGGPGGAGGPGMGPGGDENPDDSPPPLPQGQRPGRGGRGGGGRGQGGGPPGGLPGGGPRGDGQADQTPRLPPGGGSGPNGEYTIEDLMRLRDEYQRQQGGGGI